MRRSYEMILVIDNFDSFTYNLVHLVATLGVEVQVRRSNRITSGEARELAPHGLVLSPGPCGPRDATQARAILDAMAGRCPILGVCLGHQLIADYFGARVERAPAPVHGKPSRIHHDGRGVFTNAATPFSAIRYHSLAVAPDSVPAELEVSARADDGVIMGLRHRTLPIEGVQFHPESILSEEGQTLVGNFLRASRSHQGTATH